MNDNIKDPNTPPTDRLQVEEVAPRTIFPLRSYHNLQASISIVLYLYPQ